MTEPVAEQTFESLDDLQQALIDLRSAGNENRWAMGDLVNTARAQFGSSVLKTLSGATGYSARWLSMLAAVSAIWRGDERRLDVTWDLYCVAEAGGKGNEAQAREWLNHALTQGMSAADLRKAIVQSQGGGTSFNSKLKATRFVKNANAIEPHLNKLISRSTIEPWRKQRYEDGYEQGQADLWAALQDPLMVAKAFEAEDR